jgi:hypothetical protein
MAIVRVWTSSASKEWLVDTETRKVSPAESGYIGVNHPLCLEDFREPGRTAVEAFDREGHRWLLNLDTFRADPTIAGGDAAEASPSENRCPHHKTCELQKFQDDDIAVFLHARVRIIYCPLLECDYVDVQSAASECGPFGTRIEKLTVMTAARQKVFFKKFIDHFVGNGR